jgi:hypothetical protein
VQFICRSRRVVEAFTVGLALVAAVAIAPGASSAEDSDPPPPVGGVLFNVDYAGLGLRAFDGIQEVAKDRIQIVPAPGDRAGQQAIQFDVGPRDTIGKTSPRAELVKLTRESEGTERWYRWSTFFPTDFPTSNPNAFVTWTQWRASDESDSYSNFMLWGNELQLRLNGIHWREPLVKGVWHDIVYHVKWSSNPDVGFIELWFDGRHVLPPKSMRTLKAGTTNYFKQGLYHSRALPAARLYHTGLTISTQ